MPPTPPNPPLFRRLAPTLLAALAVLSLTLAVLARGQITPETIATHHAAIMSWRDANLVTAVAGFFALYACAALVSVPGIAALTLLGGYLFGAIFGTFLVVSAATLGATALYLVTRAGLGDWLFARWKDDLARGRLASLVRGLRDNELKALFLLRMAPVVPFFLANTLPALFGVGLRNFLISTFFGLLPGSAVIALAGRGVGEVLEAGGKPGIGILAPILITIPAIILGVVLAVRLLRQE